MKLSSPRKVILQSIICLILIAPTAVQGQAEDNLPTAEEVEKYFAAANLDASLVGLDQEIKALLLSSISQQDQSLAARTDPEKWSEIMRTIDQISVEYIAGYRNLMIRAHQQKFSSEELKAYVEFFKTPAGRRIAAKTPPLMEHIAKGMVSLQDRMIETARNSAIQILNKRKKDAPL